MEKKVYLDHSILHEQVENSVKLTIYIEKAFWNFILYLP